MTASKLIVAMLLSLKVVTMQASRQTSGDSKHSMSDTYTSIHGVTYSSKELNEMSEEMLIKHLENTKPQIEEHSEMSLNLKREAKELHKKFLRKKSSNYAQPGFKRLCEPGNMLFHFLKLKAKLGKQPTHKGKVSTENITKMLSGIGKMSNDDLNKALKEKSRYHSIHNIDSIPQDTKRVYLRLLLETLISKRSEIDQGGRLMNRLKKERKRAKKDKYCGRHAEDIDNTISPQLLEIFRASFAPECTKEERTGLLQDLEEINQKLIKWGVKEADQSIFSSDIVKVCMHQVMFEGIQRQNKIEDDVGYF